MTKFKSTSILLRGGKPKLPLSHHATRKARRIGGSTTARDFANPAPPTVQLDESIEVALRFMREFERLDLLVLDELSVLGRIRFQEIWQAPRMQTVFVFELARSAAIVHEEAAISHAFRVAMQSPGQSLAVVNDLGELSGELGPRELAMAAHAISTESEDGPPSSRRAA